MIGSDHSEPEDGRETVRRDNGENEEEEEQRKEREGQETLLSI